MDSVSPDDTLALTGLIGSLSESLLATELPLDKEPCINTPYAVSITAHSLKPSRIQGLVTVQSPDNINV